MGPVEAGYSPGWLVRATGITAGLGGMLTLGVALLVCTSVLGRWLADRPIDGDFELVKIATGIAVFAYLPYTQARRGNITVDTFTSWLPRRVQAWIDALWDLVYAGIMAVLAVGLAIGASEASASGEATMQLQLIVWPVIALCALLAFILVGTALVTAWSLVGRRP